MLQLVKTGK